MRMNGRYDAPQAARDASFTTGSPAPALRDLLRESLRSILVDDHFEQSPEGTLRQALREACAHARRTDVRPEHVIVALKQAWREVPERTRVPSRDAHAILARVVTACINEYYEDSRLRGPSVVADRAVRLSRFGE